MLIYRRESVVIWGGTNLFIFLVQKKPREITGSGKLTHGRALLPHHNNAEILENAITAGLDSC